MTSANEWDVLWRLGLGLALASAIGVERELRQKSAGLRTYTLVGLGSALFMLISQYGFFDVLGPNVVLDPSRVAAQIVSGIGFIGAGIIFVRREDVRGLTTAAGIWLTAAVGAAAGAGLEVLAIATTLAYFLVAYAYPAVMSRLPASRHAPSGIRVAYEHGRGVLREVISTCAQSGFAISDVAVVDRPEGHGEGIQLVEVRLEVRGTQPVAALAGRLGDLDGVHEVHAGDVNEFFD
jgi:putative Mg2+ transporter-C (MgtC) family protein